MKILIVLLSFLGCAHSSSRSQPTHVNLTQSVDVACWKSGTSYSMTVYLTAGNDSIDLLYAVAYLDPTDASVGLFDSNGNGITGNGSDTNPYTFTITGTGDLPGTPLTLQQADIDNKKAYVKSPDVIGIDLISKAIYIDSFLHHMYFPEDVRYSLYCNYSETQDDVVRSGQIFATGAIGEAGYILDDTAVLEIIRSDNVTTSVILGDEIQLSVRAITPTRSTGVYVHSCSICDSSDCGGIAIQFIDNAGCSLVPTYFTPFTREADASAATNVFEAFSISNQDYIYFQCSVNFCYTQGDTRCQNFCAYNSVGRKKRQAGVPQSSADTLVATALRITINTEGVQPAESQSPTGLTSPDGQTSTQPDTALLAVIITLSGLLALAIMAFLILFWRTSKRNSDLA